MPEFFEFEVELAEIRPRIWRRFLLRRNANFYDLHIAIQACGWQGGHLWAFMDEEGGVLAGIPDDEFGNPDPDARMVLLSTYFTPGSARTCRYVYDFGDNWEHSITLKRVVRHESDGMRVLVGGERSFPPEDCGGVSGYERIVEFLRSGTDPWNDRGGDLKEWIGYWRPESFDWSEEARLFSGTGPEGNDLSWEEGA